MPNPGTHHQSHSHTQPIQLTEQLYISPLPLQVHRLRELLVLHPTWDKVNYVLDGLTHGFALEYQGHFKFRAPQNLASANADPTVICNKLYKEVKLGTMAGPFAMLPFPNLMCLPVGLVPKKDSQDLCMIMHLSYPYVSSINDFINPIKVATKYQEFQAAIDLVIREGCFCWLSKGDV